jgi:hypothetical protein
MPRNVPFRVPITRMIELEGVPLVITLTEKSVVARIKRHRRRYVVSLSGLFLAAIRDAKRHAAGPLAQEEIDLRIPREV